MAEVSSPAYPQEQVTIINILNNAIIIFFNLFTFLAVEITLIYHIIILHKQGILQMQKASTYS